MTQSADGLLNSRVPDGPIAQKWDNCKNEMKLVAPNNKRKFDIIVVGTGLAGASAAASLAELGYNVKAFCYQDSPRRAHSISAQGGINAAKNYPNDGDSIWRLFYDTVKGATSDLERQTSIGWHKSAMRSSTSVSPREFRLHANTAARWPTEPSAGLRSLGPFIAGVKPGNNSS